MAERGFDFEDLVFFGGKGSAAEGASMDSFLFSAVEGFNFDCLVLCSCMTMDVEGRESE